MHHEFEFVHVCIEPTHLTNACNGNTFPGDISAPKDHEIHVRSPEPGTIAPPNLWGCKPNFSTSTHPCSSLVVSCRSKHVTPTPPRRTKPAFLTLPDWRLVETEAGYPPPPNSQPRSWIRWSSSNSHTGATQHWTRVPVSSPERAKGQIHLSETSTRQKGSPCGLKLELTRIRLNPSKSRIPP